MTKDEALQMCLEYIETDAHERKYVRHAIKEALAQPEQIAVCIGYWNQKTGAYYKPDQISASHQKLIEDGILRRCYTTPPQRKPLTDAQIGDIAAFFYPRWQGHEGFARAIEAAHGIKEKNT